MEAQDRNVQLPFRTTPELLEDCRVEWLQVEPKYRVVHVWENGSDQPRGQTQTFREKTNMKENLINTGDLSLTLEDFIEDDSGKYKCTIHGKHGRILQEKTVQVLMKGELIDLFINLSQFVYRSSVSTAGTVQVQNQPKDIRTRGSSVDPTPLMADQSVS